MATYLALYSLAADPDLVARVSVAIAIVAEGIRTEAPATAEHVRRIAWAKRALVHPDGMARQLMWVVLAQNASLTVAQVTQATDAQIKAAVESAVELLL